MIFLFHLWVLLVPRRVIIHELHPYVNVSSRFLVSVLHVPISVIDGRGYPLDGFLTTSILQNLVANWSPSRKKAARDHKKLSISAYVFVHISKPSPSERVCLFRPGPGVMFTFVVLLFWPSSGEGQESRPWSCSADGPWSAWLEMDLTLLLTVSGMHQISPPPRTQYWHLSWRSCGRCICSSRCIARCMIMHLSIYIVDFCQICFIIVRSR